MWTTSDRLPAADRELVRDHARAGLQVLLQVGLQPLVGTGQEEHRHHVGRAEVHAQGAAFDHADPVSRPSVLICSHGLPAKIRLDLHTHAAGAELLRGRDHDAAVAAAQIVDHVARLDAAGLQHPFHDDLGRGNVGRQILGGAEFLSNGR